jgi:tetratricopeptide (TPR) repeat protein
LLRQTNRLTEAEALMRRALAIDEKNFSPEHANIASRLNHLALLLTDTNRLTEAEPLYRRALAIEEKNSRPDHPNVAAGLNNLAVCCTPPNATQRPSRSIAARLPSQRRASDPMIPPLPSPRATWENCWAG